MKQYQWTLFVALYQAKTNLVSPLKKKNQLEFDAKILVLRKYTRYI